MMDRKTQRTHRFTRVWLPILAGLFLLIAIFLKPFTVSFVTPALFLIVVIVALHTSRKVTLFSVVLVSFFALFVELKNPTTQNLVWIWGLRTLVFLVVGLVVNFEIDNMRKVQRYHEERNAISNVSRSLTNTLDLKELMNRVVENIIELFSADGCTIYLLNEETKELRPMACREFDNDPDILQQIMNNKVRVGFGLVGWIAATGEALISGNAEHDPRAVHIPGTPYDEESVMGIPLQRDSQVFGVLWIYKLGLDAFDAEDLQLAHIFANQVSVALANAQLYEHVRRLSETDSLTGLLNSRSLSHIAEHLIKQADSSGTPVSLLFIDCDDFKGINDRFGHPMGDHFLRFFAQVLQKAVREEDIAIRYAGDEFVIILPGTDLSRAKVVAQRLMEDVRKQRMGDIPALNTTVSVGLAVYPDHAQTAEELIKYADDALYEVKRNGKDQLAVYGEGVITAG